MRRRPDTRKLIGIPPRLIGIPLGFHWDLIGTSIGISRRDLWRPRALNSLIPKQTTKNAVWGGRGVSQSPQPSPITRKRDVSRVARRRRKILLEFFAYDS